MSKMPTTNLNNEFRYANGKIMKSNEKNKLDQYYTKPEIAKELFEKTVKIISKFDNISEYQWLEPSAGDGVFFNLLPEKNKIGIDIDPKIEDVIKMDYLDYKIENSKTIVIGNPPFGHRGVMALNFINNSFNADYVCFILPMFFESKGKGSIKYRVKNFNLLHSEKLPKNSFYDNKNNKDVNVECVFQIWSKNHKSTEDEFSWYNNQKNIPFSKYMKVYTVSLAKNRECGKKWIYEEKVDFYVSSTYYKNTEIVYKFDDVKYKSGIAIVLENNNKNIRERILKVFQNVDWTRYANKATNSCFHIGKSNIYEIVKDNLKYIESGYYE